MKPSSLLRPKSVAAMLGLMAIAIVGMKLLSELSDHLELWASVMPLLDAAEKFRLTALYGALLLLICAVLVVRISVLKKKRMEPYVPHWIFLAFIFMGLSLTKAAYIHRFALDFLRSIDRWVGLPVTIPAISAVLAGALAVPYWKFLRSLEGQFRRMLFAGAITFAAGAVLMEALTEFFWSSVGRATSYYIAASAIEELLETTGCIILIYALSAYWRDGRVLDRDGAASLHVKSTGL